MKNIFETIKRRPIRSFMVATSGIFASGSVFVIIMYLGLCLAGGKFDDFAETTRNFAWLFWMILSLAGAGLGLSLAWWGRDLQQKSDARERLENLQERYEKAAGMLSSELEATRIATCLSLADLGMADKSMKSRCVQLLFAFIREPYLETNEVEKYIVLKRDEKEKYLDKLFPADEPLRPDIQEAIASFSAICEHYGDKGVDGKLVKLPNYFWKNRMKDEFSLIKANLLFAKLKKAYLCDAILSDAVLYGANLENADLESANLVNTNLRGACLGSTNLMFASLEGVNLGAADLKDANLKNADISGASMEEVKNLEKKQILSARWGYDEGAHSKPPKLPEYLLEDLDIKEWLKTPNYDYRNKPKDSG